VIIVGDLVGQIGQLRLKTGLFFFNETTTYLAQSLCVG